MDEIKNTENPINVKMETGVQAVAKILFQCRERWTIDERAQLYRLSRALMRHVCTLSPHEIEQFTIKIQEGLEELNSNDGISVVELQELIEGCAKDMGLPLASEIPAEPKLSEPPVEESEVDQATKTASEPDVVPQEAPKPTETPKVPEAPKAPETPKTPEVGAPKPPKPAESTPTQGELNLEFPMPKTTVVISRLPLPPRAEFSIGEPAPEPQPKAPEKEDKQAKNAALQKEIQARLIFKFFGEIGAPRNELSYLCSVAWRIVLGEIAESDFADAKTIDEAYAVTDAKISPQFRSPQWRKAYTRRMQRQRAKSR